VEAEECFGLLGGGGGAVGFVDVGNAEITVRKILRGVGQGGEVLKTGIRRAEKGYVRGRHCGLMVSIQV
jgi:hypothetical protein